MKSPTGISRSGLLIVGVQTREIQLAEMELQEQAQDLQKDQEKNLRVGVRLTSDIQI